MALTITNIVRHNLGNKREHEATLAFDSSYPTGGESLVAADLGLHTIQSIAVDPKSGYVFEYDYTNSLLLAYVSAAYAPALTGTAPAGTAGVVTDNDSAATLGHQLYVLPVAGGSAAPSNLQAEASAAGLVKDSDTAASDGVALYVVVDDANWSGTYQLGHLEFVSPTNANGTCTIATGAATLNIYDDDAAATNGVAIRAVAASGGIEATTAASKDILIPVSTGKFIHVNHATTGSTPELYFDEDAANTYERIQGVIVDNADEPYKLFVNAIAATEDIPVSYNQAGLRLAQIVTVGPKPFSFTVGASGPEITAASRPDAASLTGSVALYVQAAGAGFNAANFGGKDLYVPTSTGEYLKIAYAASPAGVLVYGYPEGATANVRLLGVIVDNADEPIACANAVGAVRDTPAGTISALSAGVLSQVANAADLSAVTSVRVRAIGT